MSAVVFKIHDVGYDTTKNKKKGKSWYNLRLLAATMTPKKGKNVCYH